MRRTRPLGRIARRCVPAAARLLPAALLVLLAVGGCAIVDRGTRRPPVRSPAPGVEPAPPPPPAVVVPAPPLMAPPPVVVEARPYMLADRGDHAVVEVFYGTDRARTGRSEAWRFYGGDMREGGIEYGTCRVSIPVTHERGELEELEAWQKLHPAQAMIWKLEPGKHVVLLAVHPLTEAGMRARLSDVVARSGKRSLLVFIHGYNNSFEDAARRTAQIAWDVKFPGPVAMYSWPSNGHLLSYTADEIEVQHTWPHLKEFLLKLVDSGDFDEVNVIAHSMGNRALCRALEDVAVERSGRSFKRLILAAPDIDRRVFEEQIAPKIVTTAEEVTLYVSTGDKSLLLSQAVHGTYERVGTSLVVVPDVHTVDASEVAGGLLSLGHSYVADSRVLLADLAAVLRGQTEMLGRAVQKSKAGLWYRLSRFARHGAD